MPCACLILVVVILSIMSTSVTLTSGISNSSPSGVIWNRSPNAVASPNGTTTKLLTVPDSSLCTYAASSVKKNVSPKSQFSGLKYSCIVFTTWFLISLSVNLVPAVLITLNLARSWLSDLGPNIILY